MLLQALKHLDSAKNTWEGPDDELAQLHNTIGYAYLQLGKVSRSQCHRLLSFLFLFSRGTVVPCLRNPQMVEAIDEYKQAVAVQPGYVVAWNNLGDAYKRSKDYKNALEAYETTLRADAGNGVSCRCP